MGFQKGYTPSKEARQKMREAKLLNPTRYWLGKKRPNMVGKKNPVWRGNDIKYHPLHVWVRKHLGKPLYCNHCGGNKNLHWASISHKAKRDLKDFFSLCCSCHKKYDIEYAKSI